MNRYNYKAKDANGKLVQGEVEASTPKQAAQLIKNKGFVVISITVKHEGIFNILGKVRNRITYGQVVTFTRQLSTMIEAGLPITESLLILRNQTTGSMQRVAAQIMADVEGGQSLSSSMAKHEKVFPPNYIALVKSGELGGVLDDVLVRLAANLEKNQEFRGKVKQAMIYPVIIVIGMVIVSFIMMVFVIPRLLALYEEFEADLPTPTKILMGVSGFFAQFWWLIILVVGVLIYGFLMYRKTDAGRRKTDEKILKFPVIGPLLKEIILTELTRTLSLMVGSGVSILEGINIGSEVVNNRVISDALDEAADDIEKGFPVAYSFAKHPDAFPYLLSQMIAVGEETGKMDEVLEKVSHIFEVESDQKVKGLTAVVELMVMVVLGIGVGFLVIAVILPIYNLTSQF